jgi:hypothetical protein
MRAFYSSILALAAATVPASAITITTPANEAEVTSPFALVASTGTCDGKPATAMGYSIDHDQAIITPTSFGALVLAGEGAHILHVKCWGAGVNDEVLLNITIVAGAPLSLPANVTAVTDIQSLPTWEWGHDPGTPGDSTGTTAVVSSPSMTGSAREFGVDFTGSGGEIYHDAFASDPKATHFIYDAYVMFTESSSLANVELDMNQVMANGLTVIYAFQCSGYSGTWEYSYNVGTPDNPKVQWFRSNATCPHPSTWEMNAWHHVQIAYSRDSDGNVTYESVTLDGDMQQLIGAVGNSTFNLGWASVLATNFQLDGMGADGSLTAYADKMTVYRWE